MVDVLDCLHLRLDGRVFGIRLLVSRFFFFLSAAAAAAVVVIVVVVVVVVVVAARVYSERD